MKKNKTENLPEIAASQLEIYEWLKTVKFKKKLFGGVDEVDVWKKIAELNALYEKLILAKREKNDGE